MNEKNRKKKQAQDLAAGRIMAIFLVTVVLLWGMSYLYDMMVYGATFMQGQLVNNGVMAVSGLAAVICLVLYFTAKKRGTLHTERVVNSGFLALCFMVMCACSVILAMDYYNGMHSLYIFLPATALLFLIYHVYERQFFTFCLVEAVAIFAAYCFFVGSWAKTPALVAALVLCLIPMALVLGKSDKLEKFTHQVMGGQFNKRYTMLVYGVTLLAVIAAALLQGKLALVVGLVLGVYMLASAVYYTVKAI
ncbi:MAG: hypothetical protein IKU58_04300 [Clostridia bacterium]|nr:hypothetical protein [Clostridia bacterium]